MYASVNAVRQLTYDTLRLELNETTGTGTSAWTRGVRSTECIAQIGPMYKNLRQSHFVL